MLLCRPDIIKVDRSLVQNIDTDLARQAVVQALGSLSDRLGAFLLAEGVETGAELDALVSLGVPLAQGFFLGRPDRRFAALPAAVSRTLQHRASSGPTAIPLAGFVEAVDIRAVSEAPPPLRSGQYCLDVDDRGQPRSLWQGRGDATAERFGRPLSLSAQTPLTDALRRALTRPSARRLLPLICTDGAGRCLGIVRAEQMALALADFHDQCQQNGGAR